MAAHIVEDIETHFENLEKCRDRWGIQDADISNFDETGFQIGVMHGGKVVVPSNTEAVYAPDPDNRKLITSFKTINLGGIKVPPMLIFKDAYHLQKHFDNDMDPNTLFARPPTGFTNERLGLVHLKHFDRFTAASAVGAYQCLSLMVTALTSITTSGSTAGTTASVPFAFRLTLLTSPSHSMSAYSRH